MSGIGNEPAARPDARNDGFVPKPGLETHCQACPLPGDRLLTRNDRYEGAKLPLHHGESVNTY